MATPRLGLPEIAAAQAQKHVTHNEALALLDGLLPAVAVSATTPAAPASPAEGEAYIVPAGGAFGAVAAGAVAIWQGGVWVEVPGAFGWRLLVLDEGRERVFAGSRGWLPGAVIGAHGGTLGLACLDHEIDLAGAAVQTLAGAIPARAILLGVTSSVVETVTGPAAFRVGDGSDLSRFGGSLGLAAGSANIGVIGPSATYAPADLIVSAQDGATPFTAGRLRLSVLCILPG